MSDAEPKLGEEETGAANVTPGYGYSPRALVIWDMSLFPADNSNLGKLLGRGDSTKAYAMRSFDARSNFGNLSDGLATGRVTSWRGLDPHNWVLRLYDANGKSLGTWSHRLVVDGVHNHQKRDNRGTMVVDACDKLNWAWLEDLCKVKRPGGGGASVTDAELKFDDAGFLGLVSVNQGKKERAATMLNTANNAGFITDSARCAQWHHLVTILQGIKGGATQTNPTGCGQVGNGDACLRGDVNFDMEGERIHLALTEDPRETFGEIITGNHWIHTPAPKLPKGEMEHDPLSDQPVLGRGLERGLWVWVKLPRMDTPTEDWGRPDKFNFEPTPTPGHTLAGWPFQVDRNGMELHRHAAGEGLHVGTGGTTIIPLDIAPDWGLTFTVNFMTPVTGFAGNVNVDFAYEVAPEGKKPLGVPTDTIAKTLNAATYPIAGGVYFVRFHVPYEKIKDAPGGKLRWVVMRRSDDSQLDDWDQVDKGVQFGKTLKE